MGMIFTLEATDTEALLLGKGSGHEAGSNSQLLSFPTPPSITLSSTSPFTLEITFGGKQTHIRFVCSTNEEIDIQK